MRAFDDPRVPLAALLDLGIRSQVNARPASRA
jgi:hypothetical protein